MRDAELLLRYYAFQMFLQQYAGSMKGFLDLATRELNHLWIEDKEQIRQQAEQFECAVDLTYSIFGSDAFRKWKDGNFMGRFNRAVYDVIMFHFWKPEISEVLREKAHDIKEAYIKLSENNKEFVESVETTTKSLTATVTRLSAWTNTLNDVLGTNFKVPKLIDNRIRF